MLDKLIESKGHAAEQKTIGGFMLSTGLIIISLLLAGVVYSLFSYNLVLGAEAFELNTLVAPVDMQVEQKPEPPPAPDEQRREAEVSENKLPTRQKNIQRPDESPIEVPKSISVTPNEFKARPNSAFILGKKDIDPVNSGGTARGTKTGSGGKPVGISGTNQVVKDKDPVDLPEPPALTKKEPVKEVIRTVSGGVVNGKAITLITPNYPSTAKNLNVRGEVKVQVVIDENGQVVSASAVSGHPLLRNSAVSAARASTFSPTTLSNRRVKVSGVIVYRFS